MAVVEAMSQETRQEGSLDWNLTVDHIGRERPKRHSITFRPLPRCRLEVALESAVAEDVPLTLFCCLPFCLRSTGSPFELLFEFPFVHMLEKLEWVLVFVLL